MKCYSCGKRAVAIIRDVGMSHTMDIPLCPVHIGHGTILRWLNPVTLDGRTRYRVVKRRGEWVAIRLHDNRQVVQHRRREFVCGTLERMDRQTARMREAVIAGRVNHGWPGRVGW